jgi:hypothetical protein
LTRDEGATKAEVDAAITAEVPGKTGNRNLKVDGSWFAKRLGMTLKIEGDRFWLVAKA